jgi:hypothetical protein
MKININDFDIRDSITGQSIDTRKIPNESIEDIIVASLLAGQNTASYTIKSNTLGGLSVYAHEYGCEEDYSRVMG